MSQQLIPVSGGVQTVQTTTTDSNQLQVLSTQYIETKNLSERPTEWVAGGRPIYRRLPAVSETYQIDFFNLVPAPNTAVQSEVQRIGYVYIPWGQGLNSAQSLQVSSSESNGDLLIKGGTIIWEYGPVEILPTIVNMAILDIVSGQYELGYQLVYDDSPTPNLYQVENFALTGLPLTITSSTDSVVGWRYSPVNAFINRSNRMWANRDSYFPSFAQPQQSYIQWQSDLEMAYSQIRLRCPPETVYTGTATLFYVDSSGLTQVDTPIQTVPIDKDDDGQFFEFNTNPVFQSEWKIEFSSLDISVQSLDVTGVITLLTRPASPTTRATLIMYPTGAVPKTVTTSTGETVPATYCPLAVVDIGRVYNILKITDVRYIIHRDYQPVADWLTKPFDDALIDLYEQVEQYGPLWLAPPSCMKQEYLSLEQYQINIEV